LAALCRLKSALGCRLAQALGDYDPQAGKKFEQSLDVTALNSLPISF
jgi:hypothetical protein